ncbi:aspartate aminotransferase family protein [Chitinimonas sp.]|uniref:pyridoxal phosphate-dependent decarboxylase family protein n=1 Tax=Chitinimonas sp. TaxID=1934313 RepID=UPI0035AE5C1E
MTQPLPDPRFAASSESLDPEDWQAFRAMGHRMLDDLVDFMASVRERPVWQPMPDEVREALKDAALPEQAGDLAQTYADYQTLVAPYIGGNIHPRFLGWVHGAGNPVGVLADMLAAGLDANLGGRDHAPIEVERQVIRWAAQMLGFPDDASGTLVTGTSLANFIAVLVARSKALGVEARRDGLAGHRLLAYTSTEAHNCVARAMDMAGLGTAALRLIRCDSNHRMRLDLLEAAIAEDRRNGGQPFLVVGSAGTVDTGAIDDLAGIARLCQAQGLWFHADAAFGALAVLSPAHKPLLAGLESADSVAFDFHKWAQVPYDAGCVLVRDAQLHAATFATTPAYLRREARGLAAGHPWPTDFGPDLSRGFRALKVWMTLKVYGTAKLGDVVARNCALAQLLASKVDAEPTLERLAPVALNIVCFGFRDVRNQDQLVADVVADVQESGVAVPSTTLINGRLVVRVAFVNHRTRAEDVDILFDALLVAAQHRSPAKS